MVRLPEVVSLLLEFSSYLGTHGILGAFLFFLVFHVLSFLLMMYVDIWPIKSARIATLSAFGQDLVF